MSVEERLQLQHKYLQRESVEAVIATQMKGVIHKQQLIQQQLQQGQQRLQQRERHSQWGKSFSDSYSCCMSEVS